MYCLNSGQLNPSSRVYAEALAWRTFMRNFWRSVRYVAVSYLSAMANAAQMPTTTVMAPSIMYSQRQPRMPCSPSIFRNPVAINPPTTPDKHAAMNR
jgi:hypothetical protein